MDCNATLIELRPWLCRYVQRKWPLCSVEDVVQEVCLKAVVGWERTSFVHIGATVQWLKTICHSVQYDTQRRAIRRFDTTPLWATDAAPVSVEREVLIRTEIEDAVRLMGHLNATQRSLVIGAALGYEYHEMAEALDIEAGTVKSALHRGKQKLLALRAA